VTIALALWLAVNAWRWYERRDARAWMAGALAVAAPATAATALLLSANHVHEHLTGVAGETCALILAAVLLGAGLTASRAAASGSARSVVRTVAAMTAGLKRRQSARSTDVVASARPSEAVPSERS
jgi:hypothetical protein